MNDSRSKRRSLPALVGLVLCVAWPALAEEWWNSDWAYRHRVFIDATSIEEALADFPLRLELTDAVFARVLAAPDGHDLRAIDQTGNPLAFEIAAWQPNRVEVYVRCPEIRNGGAGQYVDLYFGNAGATQAACFPVWDEHYRVVLHLEGDRRDSTGRPDIVTADGFVVQNGWTPGLMTSDIHPWLTFDDGFDHGFLKTAPDVVRDLGRQFTVTLRFRTRRTTRQCLVAATGGPGSKGFSLMIDATGDVVLRTPTANGSNSELRGAGLSTEGWQCASIAFDSHTGIRQLTVNGAHVEHNLPTGQTLDIEDLRIGRGVEPVDDYQFHGDLDEVWISDIARSPAWLMAETEGFLKTNPMIRVGPLEQANAQPTPPSPDLVAPIDGAQSHRSRGVTLNWLPSVGAERYRVALYGDAEGVQPLTTIDAANATSLNLEPREAGTVYWTVVATSAAGDSPPHELRRLDFVAPRLDAAATPAPPQCAIAPALQTAPAISVSLDGYLRGRLDRMAEYMARLPEINPALLQMLRDRNRSVVPWAGVFPGQYLSSAVLISRMTDHPGLNAAVQDFVQELLACQAADGSISPFAGMKSDLSLWGHYSVLYGLLLYYEDTKDPAVLAACRAIADGVLAAYGPEGDTPPTLAGANEAIAHALLLLYKHTGDVRQRNLAEYFLHQVTNEPGGSRYYWLGTGGRPLADFPVRRWESVHNLSVLCEMYAISGHQRYREAAENVWRTLLSGERHSTGGFSTDEGFLGSPYITGTIETCCTVAWTAVSFDLLRMTGASRVADEMEWSTLNSALGSIPYSGWTSSYSNPMDGVRNYGNEIRGQGPACGPDLNCCSTNAARGLGMIGMWALMTNANGAPALNYYGPGTLGMKLPSGNALSLKQTTEYPADGQVLLQIALTHPESFPLSLRIPRWSTTTIVCVNGSPVDAPVIPGSYLMLERTWHDGDTVAIQFDFALRVWQGGGEYAGKFACYRGPLLFAADTRFGEPNAGETPLLDASTLSFTREGWTGSIAPWVMGRLRDGSGTELVVCDFSSAGQTGNPYRSWLPGTNLPPAPESTEWPWALPQTRSQ